MIDNLLENSGNQQHSNCLATATYCVGTKFKNGISLTLSHGVRAFAVPLTPGRYGQYDSTFVEICYRILLIFLTLVLLPFTILFGAIGMGLCCLANLARKKCIYIYPKQPSLSDEMPKTVKITTFNLAFLPDFIALHSQIPLAADRTAKVAQEVLARDDDLVLFQEAFHFGASAELAMRLREKYPYIIYEIGSSEFNLNSGLMIASKFPLIKACFWQHEKNGGMDKYGNKGLLATTVQLSTRHEALVFNTHLNGGAHEIAPDGVVIYGDYFRSEQIKQISRQLEWYIDARDPKKQLVATWLCGDFNIGPRETPTKINHEWAAHAPFFRGRFSEYYEGDGPNDGLPNTGTAINMNGELESECLDHILTKQESKPSFDSNRKPHIYRDLMAGTSDHAAVRAIFHLTSNI